MAWIEYQPTTKLSPFLTYIHYAVFGLLMLGLAGCGGGGSDDDGGGNTTVRHILSVTKGGTGSGIVSSNPLGIDCGRTCSATYGNGQTVTLTAKPQMGSAIFDGWGGACAGNSDTCTVTMDQAQSVIASFTREGFIAGRYEVIGTQGENIRDVVTGLEWERCSFGQTWNLGSQRCDGTATIHTWNTAVTLTSLDGFRLPTKEELRTIVYCSNTRSFDSNGDDSTCGTLGTYNRPTVVAEAFPNTPSWYFWTSSPDAFLPGGAQNVSFDNGGTSWFYDDGHGQVRLVRKPISDPEPVDVIQPHVKLYRKSDGLFSGTFNEVSLPYSSLDTVSANLTGMPAPTTYSLGTFKLLAQGQKFTVTNLLATDANSNVAPFFTIISDGYELADGVDVEFELVSPLTGGLTADIDFTFVIEETGEIFSASYIFTSN